MKRQRDNFILFYKDNFDQYKDDNPFGIYCLSASTVDMLLSMVRFGGWPTRWRLDKNDKATRVTGDDWIDVSQWSELAVVELVKDMACDFTEGLGLLADAIRDASNKDAISELADAVVLLAKKPCCEDNTQQIVNVNGGVNGSLPSGDITYGTDPYGTDPVTVPPGYEDEEQYLTNKCSMAHAMADGIITMLYGLDGIATFQAIAGTTVFILGTVGILVLPEVVIPALIAAVSIAWLASGTLYAVAQEVENRKDELVCILYTTDTPSTAISLVADFFDVCIAAVGPVSAVAVAIKTILMILVNETTLGQLYDEYSGYMYPSADCSSCGESYDCGEEGEPQQDLTFSTSGQGSFTFEDNTLTINAIHAVAGNYGMAVSFGSEYGTPPYNARWLKEIVSCSSHVGGSVEDGYFMLLKVDGVAITVDGRYYLGYSDIETLNDILQESQHCVAFAMLAYLDAPGTLVLEFGEPVA